jgi:hypothetical protein
MNQYNEAIKIVLSKLKYDLGTKKEEQRHGAMNDLWIEALENVIDFIEKNKPTEEEFVKFCKDAIKDTEGMAVKGVYIRSLNYLKWTKEKLDKKENKGMER